MEPTEKIIVYKTKGTCSRRVRLRLDGNIIREVSFEGGCSGNLQGICKLIVGMEAQEVIELLQGIDCGGRGTSCPDQLARALQSSQ